MKRINLQYWIPMGLFTAAMAASGVADLVHAQPIVDSMTHLGFPLFVATLLGIWKLLGVGALLIPGAPRLKEWAYAGFAFDLTGAAFGHAAVGDGIAQVATPLVLLAIGLLSWRLAPSTRRLEVDALAPQPA